MSALGLIETRGLVAAIEGADAMVKSADVTLLSKTHVGAGLVTITVTGDVAAVKSSVDAAAAAISRLQGAVLVTSHVIPRPESGVVDTLLVPAKESASEEESDPVISTEETQCTSKAEPEVEPQAEPEIEPEVELEAVVIAPEAAAPKAVVTPSVSESAAKDSDSKECQAEENSAKPVNEKPVTASEKTVASPAEQGEVPQTVAELSKCTLAKLRSMARKCPDFPIDKKKLSKVKKRTLIDAFTRYYNLLNS